MYEIIQVSEQSYYIQSPAKIGLVKLNEQDVYNRERMANHYAKHFDC